MFILGFLQSETVSLLMPHKRRGFIRIPGVNKNKVRGLKLLEVLSSSNSESKGKSFDDECGTGGRGGSMEWRWITADLGEGLLLMCPGSTERCIQQLYFMEFILKGN